MFERAGDPQNGELFLGPIKIDIDTAIKKEKREQEREKRGMKLKGTLKEKGMNDPEFKREFSQWYGKEQEIIDRIEDQSEYNEEQVRFLVYAAEIFAEIGFKCNDRNLIIQALDRLEGTEDSEYMDGVLFDSVQKADAGIIDKKMVEDIETKISELKRAIKQ